MKLKLDLYAAYKARGIPVDIEVDFKQRRADVVMLTPQKNMVVLELQRSAISREEISTRAAFYSSVGAAQAWIPILEDLDGFCGSEDGLTLLRPKRAAKHDFIRWIDSFHFGKGFWAYSSWNRCFTPMRLCYDRPVWDLSKSAPPSWNRWDPYDLAGLPFRLIHRKAYNDYPEAYLFSVP